MPQEHIPRKMLRKVLKENKTEGKSLRTIIKDYTVRKSFESIGALVSYVPFESIGALGA